MAETVSAGSDSTHLYRDSLRARLIASHVIVLLIALGLVLLMSAAFLRRYENAAARERLADLAVPLIAEVNVARLNDGAVRTVNVRLDALDAQAEAMDVRLLILDRDGTVRYDTEGNEQSGQSLPDLTTEVASVLAGAAADEELHFELLQPESGDLFAGKQVLVGAGQTGPLPARHALIIVSEERRFPLLGRFLPRLLLVTGLSLLVASGAGLLLSRRIARPIERLTVAANEMAAGNLDQRVPGEGQDEIGRLVGSFNDMSRQIASTYRSQRELLANVAHELRTPLTSVQGYARAIQDGTITTGAERSAALEVIERESERMNALIAQLLDLARLESGQVKLVLQPVPVTHLFAQVTQRFQQQTATKQIALTGAAPPDLFVRGDESRLIQVLTNLVANAIRHTPAGGAVSLSGQRIVQPGSAELVRITVADTGEGIAAERLPVIFDRFERCDEEPASTGARSQFGLGLTIVRELVELHGGWIAVSSEIGTGTTFTIDLPG